MGYYLAGFDVIGVDLKPQKLYPFPICRRESLSVLADHRLLAEFDLIHASPPCQSESVLRHATGREYEDLLTPTLELLATISKPWVVENVAGTVKMPGAITLCGTHFNLGASGRILRRHRLFLSNRPLPDPGPCWCRGKATGGVYGALTGGPMKTGWKFSPDEAREAMGIDWMSRKGLALAIPPDYTRWVGEQLLGNTFGYVPARDHKHDWFSSGRIENFARL
jgi:DNA (cytosine-5)-methyltransferase 1